MKSRADSPPEEPFVLKSWRDFPPMNTSVGTMRHNRTGSWRYLRPIYEDKVPACQNACPAGSDVEAWIRLLQAGHEREAYHRLRCEQPFPAILGRVCFRFCEAACSRNVLDQNVQIAALERYLGDRFSPRRELPLDAAAPHGARLAVVGSGPAGMAAAFFARRLGFDVVIHEARQRAGGLLQWGIPAYRLPKSIVAREFAALEAMGIELKLSTAVAKTPSLQSLEDAYDYVFVATGNSVSLRLRIAGEISSPAVLSGLELLRRTAAGNPPPLGRSVVVIGGGNTALDAARTAIRRGCQTVILYRRSEAEMPAHAEDIARARDEGVEFCFQAAPLRIEADRNGTIAAVVAGRTIPGPPDPDGRCRPILREDEVFRLAADSIITAIGEAPDFGYLQDRVHQSQLHRLATTSTLRLAGEGGGRIYVGGDISGAPQTVVHALATGKKAAIAMECHRSQIAAETMLADIAVGNGSAVSFSRFTEIRQCVSAGGSLRKVVDAEQINPDYYRRVPPVTPGLRPAKERRRDFEPYEANYRSRDAHMEADRCLHCGRCTGCDNCRLFCPDMAVIRQPRSRQAAPYRIDYAYCKGCGICQVECPRGAITLISEEA